MLTHTPIVPLELITRRKPGRTAMLRSWSATEAQHEARTIIGQGGPFGRAYHLLMLFRDYLAIAEERLFSLEPEGTQYESFQRGLLRLRQAGIIECVPPQMTTSDLFMAGLRPSFEGNRRAGWVWKAGPIGEALMPLLWDMRFAPVGTLEHMVHHALAFESLVRLWQVMPADYEMWGPRQASAWDAENQRSVITPDGMLVLKDKKTGHVAKAFALEYHNANKMGTALPKIDVYDRIRARSTWEKLWDIRAMPDVLVVWRHEVTKRDYERQLWKRSRERRMGYDNDQSVRYYGVPLKELLAGEVKLTELYRGEK